MAHVSLRPPRKRPPGAVLAVLTLVLGFGFLQVGCRTTPKIDWAARVGHFTFDQAVLELGPPDKSATLTDGTTVAEWLTDRGFQGVTYRSPMYYGPYSHGPFVEYYGHPQAPDYFIRLTFNPAGELIDWKRVLK